MVCVCFERELKIWLFVLFGSFSLKVISIFSGFLWPFSLFACHLPMTLTGSEKSQRDFELKRKLICKMKLHFIAFIK